MINTFPKFTEFLPANSQTAVNANMSYLSARRKPTIVEGYQCMTKKLVIENNLLNRQAAPMLLTNGAAISRELYSPGFLTTITAMINNAVATSQFPLQGVSFVTMRTRFAGLHRPDVAVPRPLSSASSSGVSLKMGDDMPQEKPSIEEKDLEILALSKQLAELQTARISK